MTTAQKPATASARPGAARNAILFRLSEAHGVVRDAAAAVRHSPAGAFTTDERARLESLLKGVGAILSAMPDPDPQVDDAETATVAPHW